MSATSNGSEMFIYMKDRDTSKILTIFCQFIIVAYNFSVSLNYFSKLQNVNKNGNINDMVEQEVPGPCSSMEMLTEQQVAFENSRNQLRGCSTLGECKAKKRPVEAGRKIFPFACPSPHPPHHYTTLEIRRKLPTPSFSFGRERENGMCI